MLIQRAAAFAGRFGFLSREIFFKHISNHSRSATYRYWNTLITSGFFYPSRSNPDVLHLTKQGFGIAGCRAMKWRPHIYLTHDSHVANVWFGFNDAGLIERSWTEGQLKESPWDTIDILGGENIDKIPDLVVDLRGSERVVRIAVEIESTRKSKAKYDQIALAYARMPKVDLIMFFCEDSTLEYQIVAAFSSKYFLDLQKQPITILLDDFSKNQFSSKATIAKKARSFDELICRALKLSSFPKRIKWEGTGTVVPVKCESKKDVA